MSSPNERSSSNNELSLGGKNFQLTDTLSILSALPEEERQKIVRDYAITSLEIDAEIKRKVNDAKLASMQMSTFVDLANSDTEGKFSFEQEFQTGTGKAKISTRSVKSTSLVTVLIIVGSVLVLIAIVMK